MKLKLIILFILPFLVSACSRDEKAIGVGEMLRHDDFLYSVVDVETTSSIEGRRSDGLFYVVKFKCQNDAKRVEHEWKNNVAYVTDEKGNIYENNNDLQKILNKSQPFGYKDSYVTKAGTTESTIFVFDVPSNVQPYLKYRGEFLMGDMFDGNNFKKTKVRLF